MKAKKLLAAFLLAVLFLVVGVCYAQSEESDMVLIPAGEFLMGSTSGEQDERPVHIVWLDAYYIDKYEVTNEEFCQFLNEKGNQIEGEARWLHIRNVVYVPYEECLIEYINGKYQPKSGYENHPVIEVSWYGARAYAEWRGCRLPTEAEWEKAARGGLVGKKYPWGDEKADGSQCNFADKNLNRYYSDTTANDGYSKTSPVGSYPPNGYGLYDMAGNVWEWCSDRYDMNYYAHSPSKNPQGPAISYSLGSCRVIRGGDWSVDAPNLRCAVRLLRYARDWYDDPWIRYDSPGFRCAKSP